MITKQKPKLIMLIGLPGSGKSTWANQQDAIIHSASTLRKQLFGDDLAKFNNEIVFEKLYKNVVDDLLSGHDVIYILAPNGKPLMPTRRFKKIRHLLKTNQAIIADYHPFTVQLHGIAK